MTASTAAAQESHHIATSEMKPLGMVTPDPTGAHYGYARCLHHLLPLVENPLTIKPKKSGQISARSSLLVAGRPLSAGHGRPAYPNLSAHCQLRLFDTLLEAFPTPLALPA